MDHGDNPDFSSFFSLEEGKEDSGEFSGMLLDSVPGGPIEPVESDPTLSRDKVIHALQFDETKISKPEKELSKIELKRLEIKEKRRTRRKERRQNRRLEKVLKPEFEEGSGFEYEYMIEYSDEEYTDEEYYARGLGTPQTAPKK